MDFFPSFIARVQLNMYAKTSRTSYNGKKTFNREGDPAPGITLFEIETWFTTGRACAGGNVKAS